MSALLQAELIKLRTTRTFVALTAIAVGISLLLTILVCLLTDPTEESVLTDVFTTDTSSVFILVLAIVGITGEWRHRTITGAILAAPDRVAFLAAKAIAFAIAGLVLSLAISLSVMVVGWFLLSVQDLPTPDLGDLLAQIGRNALMAALLGALGVAIGALIRNQIAAIVSVLLASFIVEPTVVALVRDTAPYTPFTGLPIAIQDIPAEDAVLGDVDLLAPGWAALAELGWIVAFFAAAAALLRVRDLD